MKRILLALVLACVPALASAQSPDPYSAAPTQALMPPIVVFPGSANSVLAVDGTITVPSIAFASEPTFGFRRRAAATMSLDGAYSTSADPFLWYVGGTPAFQLGSLSLISWSSTSDAGATNDTSLSRGGAGKLTLTGTTPMLQVGGTTASFPALKQNNAGLDIKLADDSGYARITANNYIFTTYIAPSSGNVLISGTAPTVGTCTGFGTSPAMGPTNGTAAFLVTVGTAPPAGGTCTITLPAAATGWNCSGEFRTSTATMKETSTTTTTAVLTVTGTPTAGETAQLRCTGY